MYIVLYIIFYIILYIILYIVLYIVLYIILYIIFVYKKIIYCGAYLLYLGMLVSYTHTIFGCCCS